MKIEKLEMGIIVQMSSRISTSYMSWNRLSKLKNPNREEAQTDRSKMRVCKYILHRYSMCNLYEKYYNSVTLHTSTDIQPRSHAERMD